VSFLTTHRRELASPIKGTLALHCQVARPVSESFLMLVRIVPSWHPRTTKFCVIVNSRLNRSEMNKWDCIQIPKALPSCCILSQVKRYPPLRELRRGRLLSKSDRNAS
jgi:hypothetical protein